MPYFNPITASGSIAFLETHEQIVNRKLSPFGLAVAAPILKGHWFDGKPLSLTQLQSPSLLMVNPNETISNTIVSISQALGTISDDDVYIVTNTELSILPDLPMYIYEKIRNKLVKIADAHLVSGFFEILSEETPAVRTQVIHTLNDVGSNGSPEPKYVTAWTAEKLIEKYTNTSDTTDIADNDPHREFTEQLIRDVFITPIKLSESPFAEGSVIGAVAKSYLDDADIEDADEIQVLNAFYKQHTAIIKKAVKSLYVTSYGDAGRPTLINYLKLSQEPIDYLVAIAGSGQYIKCRYHDLIKKTGKSPTIGLTI